jgi:hypothetical protein
MRHLAIYRAALAATVVVAGACSDATAPLQPRAVAATRAGADLPLASGRWSGERVLTVAGTTLQARLAQPQGAEHAGGAPTVVFLSGLDAELTDWAAVQPRVATLGARAFAYDRAGVGRSGPHSGARPSSVVADELRSRPPGSARHTSWSRTRLAASTRGCSRTASRATLPGWCWWTRRSSRSSRISSRGWTR